MINLFNSLLNIKIPKKKSIFIKFNIFIVKIDLNEDISNMWYMYVLKNKIFFEKKNIRSVLIKEKHAIMVYSSLRLFRVYYPLPSLLYWNRYVTMVCKTKGSRICMMYLSLNYSIRISRSNDILSNDILNKLYCEQNNLILYRKKDTFTLNIIY